MSTALGDGVCPLLGPAPTGGTEILDPNFNAEVKIGLKAVPPPYQAKLVQGTDFVSLKKKQKHFNDGPLLPLSPTQDQGDLVNGLKTPNLSLAKKGLVLLQNDYIPGQVKHTQKQALEKLAEDFESLPPGTTGAIVEEGFEPTGDQYTEGIHYFMEKKVSNGSFGSGDMCIDAGYSGQKSGRFFRKTMVKQNFRSAEVIVPINLNHENVTKLYGMIYREEGNSESIVELMMEPAGTALNAYIQREKVDTPRIWDITKQTMAGLNHMHYYGMIHFDMKPENLCIQVRESGCIVKITDFGSSKLPKDQIMFVGWTPEYMCRETSLLFLQKNLRNMEVITEDEITGKVDVFAVALIVMYMYTNVHVLQRLITKGKSSYNGYTDEERKNLQLELLETLAYDPNLVPYVIPDACDLDMRELLGNMTQFNHQYRYTAQEVINFIEKRDKRLKEAIQACQRKEMLKQIEREGIRDASVSPDTYMVTDIPEIAYNCMDTETGPIKLATKHKLQEKLKPYSGKGKGKGKLIFRQESAVQEMRRIEAASTTSTMNVVSKKIDDYPEPPTPVTDVSLSMARLNVEKPVVQSERRSIVAQPMNDDNARSPYIQSRHSVQAVSEDVMQSAMMSNTAPINSKVLPPAPIPVSQPVPLAQTVNFGMQQTVQNNNNNNLLAVMQMMINKGLIGVQVTENGPQLVNLPQPRVVKVSQHPSVRSGVTAVPPASPPQLSVGENAKQEEFMGNIPNIPDLF